MGTQTTDVSLYSKSFIVQSITKRSTAVSRGLLLPAFRLLRILTALIAFFASDMLHGGKGAFRPDAYADHRNVNEIRCDIVDTISI